MSLNTEQLLSHVRDCKFIAEDDMLVLVSAAKSVLLQEPLLQKVSSPVTIIGDVHAQFYDLLELFRISGEPPATNCIFLGDLVDRGYYSLETLSLVLLMKVAYPNKVTILRGNHECRTVAQIYGFYDECNTKYNNANVWNACADLFDVLSIGALIDNQVFCIHGGLSPLFSKIDQISSLERGDIPREGLLVDLLWSDPDEGVDQYSESPRGAGVLFGEKPTKQFVHANGIEFIARAHQLVQEGFKWLFDDQLVTVWSAPNYCYRCGNKAAVLSLSNDGGALTKEMKVFTAVPDSKRKIPESAKVADNFQ